MTPHRFQCAKCGLRFQAPLPERVGQALVSCPKCGHAYVRDLELRP